jgi:5-methylcytosine-specific restriction endonuclease McrA
LSEFKRDKRRSGSGGFAGICKVCSQQSARTWRTTNRDHVRMYDKERDATRTRVRTQTPASAETHRLSSKLWPKKYPDKARQFWRRKRAIRQGAPGYHTLADVERIRLAQKNCCAYCRRKLGKKFHVDHIQPLSRDGTDWPNNLQIVCGSCNSRKHAKDPIQFAQELGLLV